MGAELGRESDALTFLRAVADAPYRYGFYGTLRRLECLYEQKPRWGHAKRPADEPVRFGQAPELTFAPSSLASCELPANGRPPRLQVLLFGLLGPNGPLPLHITEYVRERLHHAGDRTPARFLDLFHHRFVALFYRAWAQAQPHVNHDRPQSDRFANFIASFIGIGEPALRDRDSVADVAKLFHAGVLIRQPRNAAGLVAIVKQFFGVAVRVEEFVGGWMTLGSRERTYLAGADARLGGGAVLGGRVWDRQHRFRIHLGPLRFAEYERFLPGGASLRELADWVRLYLGFELDWDVRLQLAGDEVPRLQLGRQGKLGWTTWLGERRSRADASDLCLNAERFVTRHLRRLAS